MVYKLISFFPISWERPCGMLLSRIISTDSTAGGLSDDKIPWLENSVSEDSDSFPKC